MDLGDARRRIGEDPHHSRLLSARTARRVRFRGMGKDWKR